MHKIMKQQYWNVKNMDLKYSYSIKSAIGIIMKQSSCIKTGSSKIYRAIPAR